MREIKFRGINEDQNIFIFGCLLDDGQGKNKKYQILQNEMHYDGYKEVKEKTVGQYTGLKDKKGVEIYEGDIIKHPNADEPEDLGWLVVYRANGFDLKCVRLVNGMDEWFSAKNYLQFEVIGNIHENPELLKS